MRTRSIGLVAALAFLSTIVVANYLTQHHGLVPVGFGLHAPAGVYAIGVALILRDVVQRTLGRWTVVGLIVVGALLSLLVAPSFAVASGVAFLFSELADFAVYTPLAERSWTRAMVASNIVGAFVDSILFLSIAFGSLVLLWGQVVGKLEMTLLAVLVIVVGELVADRRRTASA